MKKLWTSLAAVMLAGTLCVSFAACGKSGDDPAAKAKAFKGVEVTEEQWNAAFEALNELNGDVVDEVTSYYTYQWTAKIEGRNPTTGKLSTATVQEEYTIRGIKNGAKEYAKITSAAKCTGDRSLISGDGNFLEEGDYERELYGEQTDDGYFVYTKDKDGIWAKEENKNSILDENGVFRIFEGRPDYADYTYDAGQKGYVLELGDKNDDDDVYMLEIFKFDSEGRFVAWIRTGTGNEDTDAPRNYNESIILFYTYQAESITLPNVAA